MSLESNKKLNFFLPDFDSPYRVNWTQQEVSAGFPSPANDFLETKIDLNKELSHNPIATFYVRVNGNSMIDAGINDKDVLVVDRSIEPKDNKIAVCHVDGEFTVKRIKLDKDCLYLLPENKNYQPIKIDENNNFIIWGIVTYIIKAV